MTLTVTANQPRTVSVQLKTHADDPGEQFDLSEPDLAATLFADYDGDELAQTMAARTAGLRAAGFADADIPRAVEFFRQLRNPAEVLEQTRQAVVTHFRG